MNVDIGLHSEMLADIGLHIVAKILVFVDSPHLLGVVCTSSLLLRDFVLAVDWMSRCENSCWHFDGRVPPPKILAQLQAESYWREAVLARLHVEDLVCKLHSDSPEVEQLWEHCKRGSQYTSWTVDRSGLPHARTTASIFGMIVGIGMLGLEQPPFTDDPSRISPVTAGFLKLFMLAIFFRSAPPEAQDCLPGQACLAEELMVGPFTNVCVERCCLWASQLTVADMEPVLWLIGQEKEYGFGSSCGLRGRMGRAWFADPTKLPTVRDEEMLLEEMKQRGRESCVSLIMASEGRPAFCTIGGRMVPFPERVHAQAKVERQQLQDEAARLWMRPKPKRRAD